MAGSFRIMSFPPIVYFQTLRQLVLNIEVVYNGAGSTVLPGHAAGQAPGGQPCREWTSRCAL